MQFDVKKNILLKAIADVNGAVEKKNTISVLQNIKIDAKNGEINLCATDMDILITSTFACDVAQTGSTTVPAQMFFDIIRKIPDQNISIIQESPTLLKIKIPPEPHSSPHQYEIFIIAKFPSKLKIGIEIL